MRGQRHDTEFPGQPRRRQRWSTDQPGREARTALSALNLRLVLASFGLVACTLLAWWAVVLGNPVLAGILAFLALVATVDLAVVSWRRRERRRHGDTGHSLFE
jgi:hypothetical protein